MHITSKLLFAITGMLLLVGSASAQVVISVGSTYTQDFNTPDFAAEVEAAGTGVAAWDFTNNSTYLGWMRQVSAGGQLDRSDLDFIGELNGATTRFGNFGNGGFFNPEPKTDRALMSLIRAAGSEISFGVVFQVSGTSIDSLEVNYTGEQWFRAVLANTLQFQYKVLNSFDGEAFKINDETGWTSVVDLDFVALQTGSALKINGNDPINRSNLSATISLGAAANDGEYIAFRWRQVDPDPTTGAAQSGLGVDDFSVTAIPEPTTVAVWTGLAVLGLAMYRRKLAGTGQ